jgi:hypothetical protein
VATKRRGDANDWAAVNIKKARISQTGRKASLYLNVFVLAVQSFVKVSALTALAPTQTEPPFAITQVVVPAIFVLITLISVIKFRLPKAARV